MRKVTRDKESKLQTAAAKLPREEFEALKNGLKLLDHAFEKPAAEGGAMALGELSGHPCLVVAFVVGGTADSCCEFCNDNVSSLS